MSAVPADLPDLRKVVEGSLWHVDGVVQGDHVRFTVDPQHRGSDVLSEVALQQRHDGSLSMKNEALKVRQKR